MSFLCMYVYIDFTKTLIILRQTSNNSLTIKNNFCTIIAYIDKSDIPHITDIANAANHPETRTHDV